MCLRSAKSNRWMQTFFVNEMEIEKLLWICRKIMIDWDRQMGIFLVTEELHR